MQPASIPHNLRKKSAIDVVLFLELHIHLKNEETSLRTGVMNNEKKERETQAVFHDCVKPMRNALCSVQLHWSKWLLIFAYGCMCSSIPYQSVRLASTGA